MHPFAPGDRVVAINTDMSGPILVPPKDSALPYHFPDGPLLMGKVYCVTAVQALRDGTQGVFLTGLRVIHGSSEITWHQSRFRKVAEVGHPPVAVKKAKPLRTRIRRRKTPQTTQSSPL